LAFFRLPSVWLCFSFFFFSTCALSAIQSFSGPALKMMHNLPDAATAWVVTGYMLCGAAGMVVGGFLVGRIERLERVIGICLLGSAALLFVVGTAVLPGALAAVLAALAGFGTGLAGPSRDMLIKQASPPGATGRVYGTVYSGLDLGFAVAAPVFGKLLDHGQAGGVFYGSSLMLAMGVMSAALVGSQVARRGVLRLNKVKVAA
jgi:FSR family fosmidomycin resistance protein-like MFS transporter